MSVSEDSVWYHSHGVDVAPPAYSYTAPELELIAVDYSQFPLSEENKAREVAHFESRKWRNVVVKESYQTVGMNYRREFWGQKWSADENH